MLKTRMDPKLGEMMLVMAGSSEWDPGDEARHLPAAHRADGTAALALATQLYMEDMPQTMALEGSYSPSGLEALVPKMPRHHVLSWERTPELMDELMPLMDRATGVFFTGQSANRLRRVVAGAILMSPVAARRATTNMEITSSKTALVTFETNQPDSDDPIEATTSVLTQLMVDKPGRETDAAVVVNILLPIADTHVQDAQAWGTMYSQPDEHIDSLMEVVDHYFEQQMKDTLNPFDALPMIAWASPPDTYGMPRQGANHEGER